MVGIGQNLPTTFVLLEFHQKFQMNRKMDISSYSVRISSEISDKFRCRRNGRQNSECSVFSCSVSLATACFDRMAFLVRQKSRKRDEYHGA